MGWRSSRGKIAAFIESRDLRISVQDAGPEVARRSSTSRSSVPVDFPAVTPREPIHVAPRWLIVPLDAAVPTDALPIRMAPGPGFGDGSHATTELCLQALAALTPRGRSFRLLDFGSGSGILSIAAAAHLGAVVDAVEIDPHATEHGRRNALANGVADRIHQRSALDEAPGPFDFIVANILRSVLLSFAERLASLLAPGAVLVLSGLVSTDAAEVGARYAPLLGGRRPELYEREEWRALVWRGVQGPSSK